MAGRGERLGQAMAPEVQALIFAPRLAREIAHALEPMHAVNQAHLLMLWRQGLVATEEASHAACGLIGLQQDGAAALPNDPALEDLYFNFEAALVARIGVTAGGSLHAGRSRNDIGATIDRMRAREQVLGLASEVNRLIEGLLEQAERHADTVMPGYTHLQPSQPVTFGFYLLGVATALSRDVGRLLAEYERINLSPLGAGAMAGTSYAINRSATAQLLGFAGLALHSQDAVATRDYMIGLAATCASLSTTWSRLAQDFYVWASAEFGLVEFSDSVAGVSSIMPQKKNPVVLEVLKANAADVIGDLTALLAGMRATHFTHSLDATRMPLNHAWAIFDTCRTSMTLLQLLVRSVTPRTARMHALTASNFSTMTDLADAVARDARLSFREAHHVVGRLVRNALERGVAADAVTAAMLDEAARAAIGKSVRFSDARMAALLDPAHSVRDRVSAGSPGGDQVAAMVSLERARLEASTTAIDQARLALCKASAQLGAGLRELAALAPKKVPETPGVAG